MDDVDIESMNIETYNGYADEEDSANVNTLFQQQEMKDDRNLKKKKSKTPSYIKQKYMRRIVIVLIYAISLLFLLYTGGIYGRAVVSLDYRIIQRQIIFYPAMLLLPFVAWVLGTLDKYLEYQVRKIALLLYCVLNACMLFMFLISMLLIKFFAPLAFKIPLSSEVTDDMLLLLIRMLMVMPALVASVLSFHSFFLLIISKDMCADIMHFKLERYIDFRPDKKYKYDLTIVRDKITGRVFSVKEAMRAYHMAIIGATGSGKTSMAFNPAIAHDLDKHIKNLNKLKKEVKKLLNRGTVLLTKDIDDSEFSREFFVGRNEENDVELDKLFERYQRCGITVIAPNSSFADDIYELARNRGFTRINRIDPELTESGDFKPNFIGLNPLYVPLDLDAQRQYLIIVNKARVFSDVLQALFEAGGKTDVYFSGLNRQFTSSICVILMKTIPMLHKKMPIKYKKPYVTPQDFYNVINNFTLMKDYSDALAEYLSVHPEEDVNYRNKLTVIQRDILGPGAKTMAEQARGLINQAAELLDNPQIRNILCCENSVDFDRALANSEITLVNYSLALGDSDSRALGLFVMLLYQGAVFRRPKKNRPIHFVYIDEFPVLLHRNMEKCFSIFRQYNVAMGVALQSLSQFEKEPSTAFMKNVMLVNASTQIVFGRAGIEEMEIYQKLAGKRNAVVVQDTIAQSSLSDSEPSYSYSERSSLQLVDVLTGRDIRNKDFSEGTMITVDKGNPVDAFSVVLDFLTPKQKAGVKSFAVDWHRYYDRQLIKGVVPLVRNETQDSIGNNSVNKKERVCVSDVAENEDAKFSDLSDIDSSLNFDLFDLQASVTVKHERIMSSDSENYTTEGNVSKENEEADIAKNDDIADELFSNLDLKIGDFFRKDLK